MLSFLFGAARSLLNGGRYLFAKGNRKVTTITITVIAAIVLVLWISHIRSVASQARTEAATAKADTQVLISVRRADGAAVAKADGIKRGASAQEVKANAKSEEILARHPSWASKPVPAAVLDSLRD